MSNENKGFSKEEILKKIQEGDMTLLIAAAIVMVIPVVILIFLTSSGPDKGKTQERLRTLTQRKNVFNFGIKTEDGKKSGPKSGMPSSSSNWFGGTPEQRVQSELESAYKTVEKSLSDVEAPFYYEGDAKLQYEAEHNLNLCMARGAIEKGDFKEAEDYLFKALEQNDGNHFLEAYIYSAFCFIYEKQGNSKKLEEFAKLYIESVGKIPEEYGGGNLKANVRDAYQCLLTLSKYSDKSKLSSGISSHLEGCSGDVPAYANIEKAYSNFPVKYD